MHLKLNLPPPATLAIIYAITYLASVFLELPTGALADLLGRKLVTTLGLFIQGASWIIVSQTQNVVWLWVGYTISQIGTTFVSGANTALLYDSLKELKKENTFNVFLSQNELVYRVGITISTFIGGYAFLINQRVPYILVGVATIIAGIITFSMTEPQIDSEKFTLKNYIEQTKLGFRELWKTPYIRDFSLFYISIGGITWYYLYFLLNAYRFFASTLSAKIYHSNQHLSDLSRRYSSVHFFRSIYKSGI